MDHGNISKDIAKGLLALQKRIAAAKIPPSKLDETLNIASWNIREFGKVKRTEAAVHFIAEILGQFDVIGIVELRDDLTDLGRVLKILGPYWRVVYSDMIPDAGGNLLCLSDSHRPATDVQRNRVANGCRFLSPSMISNF
jgi:hypothetical protein